MQVSKFGIQIDMGLEQIAQLALLCDPYDTHEAERSFCVALDRMGIMKELALQVFERVKAGSALFEGRGNPLAPLAKRCIFVDKRNDTRHVLEEVVRGYSMYPRPEVIAGAIDEAHFLNMHERVMLDAAAFRCEVRSMAGELARRNDS